MKRVLCASLLVGTSSMANTYMTPCDASKKFPVVVLAAGLGTRMLPATKVTPKELVQIVDCPALHLIAQEMADAGCSDAIIVTNSRKQQIMSYFDASPDVEFMLERSNKGALLAPIEQLRKKMSFTYVPQPVPLGTGHATLLTRHIVGNSWFGLIYPDDLVDAQEPAMGQLWRVAKKYNACVVAVHEVPMDRVSALGIVKLGRELEPGIFEMSDVIEKPSREAAPSNLAVIGRLVLPPEIFPAIEAVKPTGAGEWWLTDGFAYLARHGYRVLAYKFKGTHYDVGNPLGWMQAVVGMGLRHPQYGKAFQTFIEKEMAERTPRNVLFDHFIGSDHLLKPSEVR